jgi:hypothetical protein
MRVVGTEEKERGERERRARKRDDLLTLHLCLMLIRER